MIARRAVNTFDMVVEYRNTRYRQFGWASARLDDVVKLPPARLTVVATVVAGPDRHRTLMVWRRDVGSHPDLSVGVVETSTAGALGLQLRGATIYPNGVGIHPVLGSSRRPEVVDVRRAVELNK